ncbi:protein GAMETE EXPRESSED 3 [Ziziphus jujuba]|uniref:Protein GAMETE EXPRESSED 3 n=1 Tax=Ziziphus jujuba TaxID=326968 RepID=A0ABM3IH73_ZIZJJ|nr:protein GAMETE EXPRESSED 3 [Ziziphus jujuba]
MPIFQILFLLLFIMLPCNQMHPQPTHQFQKLSAQEPTSKFDRRLSKPLIGYGGKIYACSEKDLFAFQSKGSIAWTIHLNYTCNADIAPIYGGTEKIYVVAENRILKINLLKVGTSEPAAQVFLSFEPDKERNGEIIGLSISTLVSSLFINIRSRGLFAYTMRGKLLWSAGPVTDRFGYRQGCRKNVTDCYFTSAPVIDQCEASIYISNTEGELYSLSLRSAHFKWIQDFSLFDKVFTVTPGNNGRLYVIMPVKALLLALDVASGNVLWQGSIGPLSTADSTPVVDCNGWISIGSLDGFIYSFSPNGVLKKFSKTVAVDFAVQVNPLLDCSGFAVYISQTEMDNKISRTISEYTYVSAMKPKSVVFTLFVPATGSIYWSERYPGQVSSSLFEGDLQHFILDERILLAFFAASKIGNPLTCRSTRQKLMSSCSQAKPKYLSIYTGNERTVLLFLLFESTILMVLAGLVRFCCIFWRKKKLQGQELGSFLEKRRSLQLKKKSFDDTITELEQKAAEEAVTNEALERISDLVRERKEIERKLSTTYSLGRDRVSSRSKPLLPLLHDGKARSYSFQGAEKESVTIFHTLSDTSSSRESSSDGEASHRHFLEEELATKTKAKAKAKVKAASNEAESSSDDDGVFKRDLWRSPSEPATSSRLFEEQNWRDCKLHGEDEVESLKTNRSRSLSLKKRRALSSTS